MRIFIIVASGLVALIVAAAVYVATSMPRPELARIQVRDNVVGVLSGYAYAYVVKSGDHVVLVDTGSDPAAEAIIAELGALGTGPERVEALLITHGHRDHVAAASMFGNARTYICDADHTLMRGDRLPQGLLPKLMGHLVPTRTLPPDVRPIVAGTVLSFGDLRFESLLVPGHTAGSCVYLLGDLLFTGDAMLLDKDGVSPPPWLFSDSAEMSVMAMKRLASLPFVSIADGHYGYAADGRARYERWLTTQR
jgi:hydroxyacylglutathione hydrolase